MKSAFSCTVTLLEVAGQSVGPVSHSDTTQRSESCVMRHASGASLPLQTITNQNGCAYRLYWHSGVTSGTKRHTQFESIHVLLVRIMVLFLDRNVGETFKDEGDELRRNLLGNYLYHYVQSSCVFPSVPVSQTFDSGSLVRKVCIL